MTNTATAVLGVARSQIGGYYPGQSPYGVWYDARRGNPGTYDAAQFCAMGLSWVFAQAGALDIFPEHAYTPSGVAWFKARKQWTNGLSGVRSGDVVYFDFPGLPARVSHVGIVESVNGDGSVNTIEFNTSGTAAGDQRNGRAVVRKRRKSYIVGYGRPAYAGWPISVGPIPGRNADGSLTIAVDGARGAATIARWQEVMGTPIDGRIDHPSALIAADQAFLSGAVGPGHIQNLTGRPTLDTDGSEGGKTVKVRQFWLLNSVPPDVQRALTGDLLAYDGDRGRKTDRVHQWALNRATARSGRY